MLNALTTQTPVDYVFDNLSRKWDIKYITILAKLEQLELADAG